MFLLKKIRNDSDYNRQIVANLEKIYFKRSCYYSFGNIMKFVSLKKIFCKPNSY